MSPVNYELVAPVYDRRYAANRFDGFRAALREFTTVAQHIPAAVPFQRAVEMGLVNRRSTSQLMVIADDESEAGVERLRRDQPVLRADLRLFATTGRLAPE